MNMRNQKESIRSLQISQIFLALALAMMAGRMHLPATRKVTLQPEVWMRRPLKFRASAKTLQTTMEALQDLVNKPAADLKPQFARFSDALTGWPLPVTKSTGRQARWRKSADYFVAWTKNYD